MPRSLQWYAWSVGVAGLSALLYFLPALTLPQLLPALGFTVFAVAFERYPMLLPNRLNFSLASTFVFLAYIYVGAPAAFLAEAAAAAIVALRSKHLVQRVFNFGQFMTSLLGFHAIVSLFGPPGDPQGWAGALAPVAGAVVFFAANALQVGTVFYLLGRRPYWRAAAAVVQETYMGVAGTVGLLLPLQYAFRHGDWLTLLLFCAALLGFRYAVNLYLRQKAAHLDSLSKLSLVLSRKMGVAETHATRVASLARSMAEALKLPADTVDTIYAAGVLHDIGEAEIDPRVVSVMARRAIPTLADLDAYRKHPALGAGLAGRMDGMGGVAELIRHHHEAWDGSGYPDGLKGDAIPLGARILAAAEAAGSLPGDGEARLTAISELAGKVIDPGLVSVLESALKKSEQAPALATAIVTGSEVIELQGKLLQAVRDSQLMETMGIGRVLSYNQGRFINFAGAEVVPPAAAEVSRLADQCLRSQQPVREHLPEHDLIFDVYCVPAGDQIASVLLFDVTPTLRAEREYSRRLARAYQDVLSAATGGRLALVEADEIRPLITDGEMLGELTLNHKMDGQAARRLVETAAQTAGLGSADLFRLKVCASEAMTNVFKHAGKGRVEVRRTEGRLRVIVSDQGDGIPLEILPKAILVGGYSTKRSLGKGFSIMLQYLDRLTICTSSEGTTIILEREILQSASVGEERDHNRGVAN